MQAQDLPGARDFVSLLADNNLNLNAYEARFTASMAHTRGRTMPHPLDIYCGAVEQYCNAAFEWNDNCSNACGFALQIPADENSDEKRIIRNFALSCLKYCYEMNLCMAHAKSVEDGGVPFMNVKATKNSRAVTTILILFEGMCRVHHARSYLEEHDKQLKVTTDVLAYSYMEIGDMCDAVTAEARSRRSSERVGMRRPWQFYHSLRLSVDSEPDVPAILNEEYWACLKKHLGDTDQIQLVRADNTEQLSRELKKK